MQRWQCPICLIKYKLDINVFVSLNCSFSFAVSLRKWLEHSLFIRSNGETRRNKYFMIIAIFAWRVTLNYAYSLFNTIKYVQLQPLCFNLTRESYLRYSIFIECHVLFPMVPFCPLKDEWGIRICKVKNIFGQLCF